MTLALLLSRVAHATIPVNNRAGDFWADQWLAAQWYGLPPHLWSIGLAALAVLGTALFVWRAPRASGPRVEPPDLPPSTHRRAFRALVAALVLFYAPGFAGDFSIYDDPKNIWLNPVVAELTWPHLREIVFENHHGVNQEWMFLSLQISYALFGKNYAGFFALNLALLPVLLYLVHELALLLMRSRRIALLATAFFGLSPIVAELLCWMLARGHYFGLIFALASCVSYLRYVEVRAVSGSPRWRYLALAVLAFAGSQLGKPIFLYVPAWLVLFDIWSGRRDLGRAILEKLPFALVAALFLWKILSGAGRFGRVVQTYIGGSIWNTLALDTNLVLEYLRSAFVPYPTGPQVPWNEPDSWLTVTGIPNVFVHGFSPLASLVILACGFVCAVVLARSYRWPVLLLAVVGAVISVGTVMNLPAHTVIHAYRYTLSMRVLVSIVLAAATVHAMTGGGPLRRRLPALAAAAWLLVAAFHANGNRAAWKTPAALWTRNADALYPYDGWSHYYAGKSLQQEKRWEECVAHLRKSRRMLPGNSAVHRRLGDCAYGARDLAAAADHWERYFRDRGDREEIERYAKRLDEVGLGKLTTPK